MAPVITCHVSVLLLVYSNSSCYPSIRLHGAMDAIMVSLLIGFKAARDSGGETRKTELLDSMIDDHCR